MYVYRQAMVVNKKCDFNLKTVNLKRQVLGKSWLSPVKRRRSRGEKRVKPKFQKYQKVIFPVLVSLNLLSSN